MTRAFLCSTILVLTAARMAGAQSVAPPLPREQPMLRPGDGVRITVWRQPELSGEFTVAEDGSIIHPVYQEIRVVGLTATVIEQRVGALLKRYENDPQFVVEPLLRVVVGGEVRTPGLFALPPGTTLEQALVLAGGATPQGKLSRVRLLRDGMEQTIAMSSGDLVAARMSVQSGDQIVVPRRTSFLRDYFWPAASIIGAAAAVLNVLRRY